MEWGGGGGKMVGNTGQRSRKKPSSKIAGKYKKWLLFIFPSNKIILKIVKPVHCVEVWLRVQYMQQGPSISISLNIYFSPPPCPHISG
jgi:hypothetical protein